MNPEVLSTSEVLLNFLAALFVIPIAFAVFIKVPKLVVLGFLTILFFFADSTWGSLEATSNIYSRGVGKFYFSLLNLMLIVAGVAALIKRLANPQGPRLAPNLSKYFLAFIFLLSGHILIGMMTGIQLDRILAYGGFINVLNMFVFMYIVIMAFDDPKDSQHLIWFILGLALLRSAYGAVRFFLMDGDPSNPYRNFEGLDIKLFFFDISDNYVAALGAFCAAWLLSTPGVRLSIFSRLFLIGVMGLGIAAVALSFRRSSLIGLALMFLFLFLRLPGHRKMLFAVVGAVVISGAATVFFEQRLQFNTQGGILESLFYDIAPSRGGIRDSRFYELYAAAQSMEGHWLFGRGTWGTFVGDRERLAFHSDFSFVHSGFGHMILKAGLVGVALFIGVLVAFTSFYLKHRKSLVGTMGLVADLGFAGFLFWVPTLLIGTPIIEFRTMLLFGFTLALPFVAVGVQNYQIRQTVIQQNYAPA